MRGYDSACGPLTISPPYTPPSLPHLNTTKGRLVSMDTTIRDLMDPARAKAFTVYPVDYFPIDASPNVNWMSLGMEILVISAIFGKSAHTRLKLALSVSPDHIRYRIEWRLRLTNLFWLLSSRHSDNVLENIIFNIQLLFYFIAYLFFLNALNKRLPLNFSGLEEKWSFIKEFNVFKRWNLPPPPSPWISNFNSNSNFAWRV